MNDAMLQQLIDGIRAANADDDVRAIVVTGAGSCFTAGRDISQFDKKAVLQDMSLDRTVDIFLETLTLLMESPKPTIAAIHGVALGGGQAMSLACDFVIAEEGSKFGNVEMAYGFPAAMNIALLTRQVGRRIGLEIAMTGSLYTAEQYHGYGLVNRLAPPGRLLETTREFASVLTSRAPWAVRRTKATYRLTEDMVLSGAMNFGNQLNQVLMLNSQIESVHSGDASARDAIKGNLSGKD
jgi:methylglutaconyl-CoA hydratase